MTEDIFWFQGERFQPAIIAASPHGLGLDKPLGAAMFSGGLQTLNICLILPSLSFPRGYRVEVEIPRPKSDGSDEPPYFEVRGEEYREMIAFGLDPYEEGVEHGLLMAVKSPGYYERQEVVLMPLDLPVGWRAFVGQDRRFRQVLPEKRVEPAKPAAMPASGSLWFYTPRAGEPARSYEPPIKVTPEPKTRPSMPQGQIPKRLRKFPPSYAEFMRRKESEGDGPRGGWDPKKYYKFEDNPAVASKGSGSNGIDGNSASSQSEPVSSRSLLLANRNRIKKQRQKNRH